MKPEDAVAVALLHRGLRLTHWGEWPSHVVVEARALACHAEHYRLALERPARLSAEDLAARVAASPAPLYGPVFPKHAAG